MVCLFHHTNLYDLSKNLQFLKIKIKIPPDNKKILLYPFSKSNYPKGIPFFSSK